jgi:hypothetical protein
MNEKNYKDLVGKVLGEDLIDQIENAKIISQVYDVFYATVEYARTGAMAGWLADLIDQDSTKVALLLTIGLLGSDKPEYQSLTDELVSQALTGRFNRLEYRKFAENLKNFLDEE